MGRRRKKKIDADVLKWKKMTDPFYRPANAPRRVNRKPQVTKDKEVLVRAKRKERLETYISKRLLFDADAPSIQEQRTVLIAKYHK